MLIDSHCHLSFKDYPESEVGEIISRANQAGVTHFITIGGGDGFEGNEGAVKVAEAYPSVYATVGIHPHDAKIVDEAVYQKIEALALQPKVVAIGEIGLDFHYEHSPREIQKNVFQGFIDLSKKIQKPVVIHDRGAEDLTYEMLKENEMKENTVIHCFTGTLDLAKKYLDLGCFISFSGIITFKKADDLREIVKFVPLDRMFVETDSPFLTPVPHRGKRNEPAFVRYVAETVASVKNVSIEEVEQTTTRNAKGFFHLN